MDFGIFGAESQSAGELDVNKYNYCEARSRLRTSEINAWCESMLIYWLWG
jgi:hypothetical protein